MNPAFMRTPSGAIDTDVLRMNILSNIKTDNIFLDILLGGIIMTFMNKFIEWVFKMQPKYVFRNLVNNLYRRKKNEIILSRKEYISSNYWDARVVYPKSILAIYNYINKQNVVTTGSMRHMEYKTKQFSDINFMADSKGPIEVIPGVFFTPLWGEEGRLVSDNNKGEKTVEHRYSLYSYNKSVRELMDFVNQRLEELETDTIIGLNKKPYYFIYDRKEEGNLVFDEYSLENDRNFDNIFFDQKEDLKSRLDYFINNREWYRKKGIPYTLGLMFSGKPGCGKTSTIKAIAKYTQRHVIDIPLTKIDNCRDLMNIFYNEEINDKKIPMNKRIYLFEDVDSILDILKEREGKEKNPEASPDPIQEQNTILMTALVNKKGSNNLFDKFKPNDKLNLGFFLNLIDGVLETPGRILIISTNHPDKLDKALVRPGRIDMKIHLEKCSKQMIQNIIEHYYEEMMDLERDQKLVDDLYEKELTPAELYQMCFRYKSYSIFRQDLLEHLEDVFEKIIDRHQEQTLNLLSSNVILTSSSGRRGLTRRRRQQLNNIGVVDGSESEGAPERHTVSDSESDQ